MTNIHIIMLVFCLSSMTFITWIYVKPALMHDFDNPELNKAPSPMVISDIIYYAEDLVTIQPKPINLILTAILIGALYILLRVGNIAYRQVLINRGVK